MRLRKLIREEIEAAMSPEVVEKQFDKDIKYLDGFKFLEKKQKDGHTIWVFEIKRKDYTLKFYITKNEQTDSWSAKVFIYWKVLTKEFTNAEGKDFEQSYGPYGSYKEMVQELNNKLKNNPLISARNYIDDNRTMLDREIFAFIEKLKESKKKLASVKDKKFDDIKKFSEEIGSLEDKNKILEKIKEVAPDEEDKQTLLMNLQKVYQLDFYLHKEKTDSLFKHIYNKRKKDKKQ